MYVLKCHNKTLYDMQLKFANNINCSYFKSKHASICIKICTVFSKLYDKVLHI